jgi:rubrerythrin
MDEQTRANLLQAMHEEAFARAKFLLFAANAEAAGQEEAAQLLDRSAAAQQDHFERMAELYELSRTVVDDLGDAIATEVRTDYQGYAAQAHRVGEIEAQRLFETIHSFKAAQREALGSIALRLKLDRGRSPDAGAAPGPVEPMSEPGTHAEPGPEPQPEPGAGADPQPGPPEYRTVHVRKSARKSAGGAVELERRLNELAGEGWTLVEAIGSQLVFARPAGQAAGTGMP